MFNKYALIVLIALISIVIIVFIWIISTRHTVPENNSIESQETSNVEGSSLKLLPVNNSSASGHVTIVGGKKTTSVTIHANVTNQHTYIAAIHSGQCDWQGEKQFDLTKVSNGSSLTVLQTSAPELMTLLPLSIHIASAASPSASIICGEITPESILKDT